MELFINWCLIGAYLVMFDKICRKNFTVSEIRMKIFCCALQLFLTSKIKNSPQNFFTGT